LVLALFSQFQPRVAVETGTFRGDTTEFLGRLAPTHTVESHLRSYVYASTRFLLNSKIHVHRGDSRAVLSKLAPLVRSKTCFVYLDAHWGQDLPLGKELEIVSQWHDPIVMVDDFAVPRDAGYGFDSYEAGTLNIDLLSELPGFHRYFPAAPSAQETGAKRGCVVLTRRSIEGPLTEHLVPG
jgi:hypothetical protein